MQQVFIEQLSAAPNVAVPELEAAYLALKKAASRENNLFAFLKAELALASLESCRYALDQPQCYIGKPHYLLAEEGDSAELLFEQRCRFVYNAAMG